MNLTATAGAVDVRGRFCSRPFEWFEIQGREVFFCCAGWVTNDGVDIEGKSVEEIWNGPEARELRASILDGSFRYCNREKCPFMNQDGVPNWEKNGSPFMPIGHIGDSRLKHIIEHQKIRLDDGPLVLNCGYDRSCNLSCPSCRNAVFALKGNEIDKELAFQDKLMGEVGKKLKVLYVTGTGDPFASSVYRRLLRTMEAGDYPGLEIHLGTNANLWTHDNWEAMSRINSQITSAHISVDAACAATYAVNRRGGDWEKLMKNLEFISSLRHTGPLKFVMLSFVVQRNNYKEMPAFVAMVERFGFDMAYFHRCEDWGHSDYREYQRRAVHLPLHPEHHRYLEVLTDSCFDKPLVGLFCHRSYREKALAIRARLGGFWLLGVRITFLRMVKTASAAMRKIRHLVRKNVK